MTNCSLMKFERIADGVSCDSFDLYLAIIGLETQFSVFFLEWPFYTGFTMPL